MKLSHVWVIEMLDSDGRWLPTVGCSLSRDAARVEVAGWRVRNPSDEFRVRKYVEEQK